MPQGMTEPQTIRKIEDLTTDLALALARNPEEVLEEASRAAKALQNVVRQAKLVLRIRTSEHLHFEAWQTVGRFYGVTAKIVDGSVQPVRTMADDADILGYRARAVALWYDRERGQMVEISAAEAICLRSEDNWKLKPEFQLASMAQTRACGKALRNVLAWVVALAGYSPTPAEEMGDIETQPERSAPLVEIPSGSSTTTTITAEPLPEITSSKGQALNRLMDLAAAKGITAPQLRTLSKAMFGKASSNDLTAQELTHLADEIDAKTEGKA